MSYANPITVSDAYRDGFRAGKADRRLGFRSEYAWLGPALDQNQYSREYGLGYQRGWLGLPEVF